MKQQRTNKTGRAAAMLCAAFLFGAVASLAQTELSYNFATGAEGWTNVVGRCSAVATNGELQMRFAAQDVPEIEDGSVSVGLAAGVVPTAVSFRFAALDQACSAVRLVLRSRVSAGAWVLPLAVTNSSATNVTVDLRQTAANWIKADGSAVADGDFRLAMMTAEQVGVYVRRHGSTAAQRFVIDDMAVQAQVYDARAPFTGRLNLGEVTSKGMVRVEVASRWSDATVYTGVATNGVFALAGVPSVGEYRVLAYVDANGNGKRDKWEASVTRNIGRWATTGAGSMELQAQMPSEMRGPRQVPYWWLNRYFGVDYDPEAPVGSGGAAAPSAIELLLAADADNDGASNYDEYVAGTDPKARASAFRNRIAVAGDAEAGLQVSVSWPSQDGRTYSVWRWVNGTAGFVLAQTGIAATAPVNTWQEGPATLTKDTGVIYKVTIDNMP